MLFHGGAAPSVGLRSRIRRPIRQNSDKTEALAANLGPVRTILDLVAQADMPVALLREALREGLQRGIIGRGEIAEARKRIRESKQLRASFEKVAA
jgi:hypothetical protein